VANIAGFAQKYMDSYVSIVNERNYEEFVRKEPNNAKVVLFSEKKKTPPILSALSKLFRGQLVFGEIRSSEEMLLYKFKI